MQIAGLKRLEHECTCWLRVLWIESESRILSYTSRLYDEQEPLLKDLNQCVEYRKIAEVFIKSKGLHSYFERNRG